MFIAKRSLEILMDILCKRCWRHIVLTHWDVCVMVLLMTCAFISACPWFPYHKTIWFIYSLFIFSYLSFYFVYSHVQAKLSDLTKNDLIQLISHLEHEVGYRDSVINDMMVGLMSYLRHSIVELLRLLIGWSCYTMISRRLVDNILPQVHSTWKLSGSAFTTPYLLYLLSITSHQQPSSPLVVCICRLAGSRPAACLHH